MNTTFSDLIRDTEKLEADLTAPVAAYRGMRDPYHLTARLVAARVLMAAMPADHHGKPERIERWKHRVDVTLDRITTDLMLGGWGMVLSVSSPPDPEGELDPDKHNRPQAQRVDHKDVVEWIRDGIAGRPGGKHITERDRKVLAEQGERGLATIVMRAYYSRKSPANYTRLRRAIQRYLAGAVESSTGNALLDAVAAAWMQHFSARFPRDLKAHVARLIRNF